MSVKFSLSEMKNPLATDEPGKYYARAQVREEIDLNRIASELAYASTLTDGDVLNVIRGVLYKIKEHLADGDSVSLGEFGKFQYQLSSEGVETKDQFTTAHIKKARIRFRPGNLLRTAVSELKFERVMRVKTRKEAKKKG